MNKDFILALNDLEKEKNIPKEMLIDALKAALVAAYKKNYGQTGNIRVDIDEETAYVAIITIMDVVDEIEDETTQISLEEAHTLDPRYMVGDQIEFEVTPEDFGRVAAQTAKQVVVQRIREAERNMIYEDFKDRQGEIVTGTVHRKRGKTLFIDLGKTEGILPAREQVPGEHFNVYDRLKVYIMDVKSEYKGPQIFLSRSHPGIVKRLFELEVPEIQDGTVTIKGIAREAGSRTKIAVASNDDNVDPVGACVGTRGSRVQAVVDELSGEKIDVIAWSDDPEELIANVLSPAKVEKVFLEENEEGEKLATVVVPDYQLSLAIGKKGQNVRLAAKVSDWKIDIKSHTQYYGEDGVSIFDELIGYDEEESSEYKPFDSQEFADAIDEVEGAEASTSEDEDKTEEVEAAEDEDQAEEEEAETATDEVESEETETEALAEEDETEEVESDAAAAEDESEETEASIEEDD